MNGWVLVFVGAGIGGALRHGANMLAVHLFGVHFPVATLFVNVLGSLIIGCVVGWLTFKMGSPWTSSTRLFVVTGVLGGFTTFSTFSLDTALLVERGEMMLAALYVGGSLALSLAAVFGGLALVRAFA